MGCEQSAAIVIAQSSQIHTYLQLFPSLLNGITVFSVSRRTDKEDPQVVLSLQEFAEAQLIKGRAFTILQLDERLLSGDSRHSSSTCLGSSRLCGP